jgi:hypothetical protein
MIGFILFSPGFNPVTERLFFGFQRFLIFRGEGKPLKLFGSSSHPVETG